MQGVLRVWEGFSSSVWAWCQALCSILYFCFVLLDDHCFTTDHPFFFSLDDVMYFSNAQGIFQPRSRMGEEHACAQSCESGGHQLELARVQKMQKLEAEVTAMEKGQRHILLAHHD
ncbi:unnamed protein product, partial [Heterosigma akashiwo]